MTGYIIGAGWRTALLIIMSYLLYFLYRHIGLPVNIRHSALDRCGRNKKQSDHSRTDECETGEDPSHDQEISRVVRLFAAQGRGRSQSASGQWWNRRSRLCNTRQGRATRHTDSIRAWIFRSAVIALDGLRQGGRRLHDSSSFACLTLFQIRAALDADFGSGRIARAAIRTMDIGSRLRGFDLFRIGHKFLVGPQFKLHIFRLRRAAVFTRLGTAFITRTAIRTGPLIFNVTNRSSASHNFSFG